MWAVGGAQSHKDFLCGSNFWESGNRDKQGSDDEDDDGGTRMVLLFVVSAGVSLILMHMHLAFNFRSRD